MSSWSESYQTLGLAPSAGDDEVRSAFRRLARDCHPDLHPDDRLAAHRFAHLRDAYSAIVEARRTGNVQSEGRRSPGERHEVPALRPWAGVDVRIGSPLPPPAVTPSFQAMLSRSMNRLLAGVAAQ